MSNRDDNTLQHLSTAYKEFCRVNNLPSISADEHDLNSVTKYQREWIEAFIHLWEIQSNQM